MSTPKNTSTNDRIGFTPLVSAVDFNEGNYVRGRFDNSLAWYVQQIGRDRAPDTRSVWSHCIGVAGELVAAAYLGAEFNRMITDDYVGDDGYDLDHNGEKVEVKTVTSDENLELKISKEQVNTADYVVLARCSNPWLCSFARRRRRDCVIAIESEETEYCDFGIPSPHPYYGH
jgi:hypothetical protein